MLYENEFIKTEAIIAPAVAEISDLKNKLKTLKNNYMSEKEKYNNFHDFFMSEFYTNNAAEEDAVNRRIKSLNAFINAAVNVLKQQIKYNMYKDFANVKTGMPIHYKKFANSVKNVYGDDVYINSYQNSITYKISYYTTDENKKAVLEKYKNTVNRLFTSNDLYIYLKTDYKTGVITGVCEYRPPVIAENDLNKILNDYINDIHRLRELKKNYLEKEKRIRALYNAAGIEIEKEVKV